MRKRSARRIAMMVAVFVGPVAAGSAASATALPVQPVDEFTINGNLDGVASTCANETTGEWSITWTFTLSSAINGFSVTVDSASAGGLTPSTQARTAIYPAGPSRTISFVGSHAYFGRDAVTQTVSYNLFVSDSAKPSGKTVVVKPVSAVVTSPCSNSASIPTTSTTVDTASCNYTPTSTTAKSIVSVLAVTVKPNSLPRTGSNSHSMLTLAALFVVAGLTLAVLDHKRRPPAAN